MKNKHSEAEHSKFSDNPERDLKIENEILHLRLQAELGREMISDQLIPPELENIFLKNVLDFEHAYANANQVRVYDFIGRPPFRQPTSLNDNELELAIEQLCSTMGARNIAIDFDADYDLRTKYDFLVNELFELQIDDVCIPGLITHFAYEHFHPNHKREIEARATEFIKHWFTNDINDHNWELSDKFILPDGVDFSKGEIVQKIKVILGAYAKFDNVNYNISDIQFEVDEKEDTGMGYAKGTVSYDASLENGGIVHFEGVFKFCLSMECQWWSVFYFVFPGFRWEN